MATGDTTAGADALRHGPESQRRADSLHHVIELISSELALAPLLTRIVESAVELIGAQYGWIGLVIERVHGPVVQAAAVVNMPPLELGTDIPIDLGLTGRVLREQRALRVDRYGDLGQVAIPQLAEHGVLGVPIWWGECMIGFFGIGAAPPRRFNDADVATLALLARHAAIAIENARRYERERRRTERLALIARIGQLVTADLRLDELLQTAADAIHELLGYPNIALPLIDPKDPATLVLRTVGGQYRTIVRGEYRLPIAGGIMGAAACTRRVQLVNDVASDPRYIPTPGAVGIRAELAVPILRGDQVLGVLNVESADPLTDEDAKSLEIIADQLAVAIENARRYAEEQQRTERLHLIARVSQRIAARLNPDEVFTTTVDELHTRLGYDHAAVFLLDPKDAGWLVKRATASRWAGRPVGYRQAITRGLMGAAAHARRAVLANDVWADPRFVPLIGAPDLRSELAMPILLGERLLGILDIGSANILNHEDETALRIVADQLAVAIDNAELFAQTQQIAVLEERHRLARELHDSVTQQLFSMTLLAQSLAPAWRRSAAEGEGRVARLLDISQTALAEMRALLMELHPPASPATAVVSPVLAGYNYVQRAGLVTALRRHITELAHEGLHVRLDAHGYLPQPPDYETALYRIAQEALANVVKHANVDHAVVECWADDAFIHLRIKDNGCGFTQPANSLPPSGGSGAHGGFGLVSMRERAEALGGTLWIFTTPEQGTTIEVLVPR